MLMYEPRIIFDNTPYVQVAHSRKVALKCYACGRTVVMNAKFCDGRSCPLCGGAVTPIGYVAPLHRDYDGEPGCLAALAAEEAHHD